MPYIKENDRDFFNPSLDEIVDSIQNPGDVCYCVYYMLKKVFEKDKKFKTISSLIGEIECAKMEFYRRIVVPYEDKKIIENGDIDE